MRRLAGTRRADDADPLARDATSNETSLKHVLGFACPPAVVREPDVIEHDVTGGAVGVRGLAALQPAPVTFAGRGRVPRLDLHRRRRAA